jgi:TPP-dependent pyruvate/acetoin dehydrogenase alpha subunit
MDERSAWDAFDPVALYLQYLSEGGVLTDAQLQTMSVEIAREIEDAFAFASESPNPVEADLYRHVYAD